MTLSYFYNSNFPESGNQVVDSNWIACYGGIDPKTASPSELAAAGYYLLVGNSPPPEFNANIYSLTVSYAVEGTSASTVYIIDPIPLPQSSDYYKNLVNSQAYDILLPSDWMVTRKSETGVEIPQAWGDWRESIRITANEKRNAIDATQTPEELSEYTQSEDFLTWPAEPSN